jgi:hypothetical protein
VRGHGLLEVVAARERQPAVRVVLSDRRAGRLDRGRRGRDVGVEVLQAEDVRVVAGRRGDAVDAEARDVLETRDADRLGPPLARAERKRPRRRRVAPPIV